MNDWNKISLVFSPEQLYQFLQNREKNSRIYQGKKLIISSNFNILRIKDDKVSPYYLFAFLTSEIGVEQLKQLMTGTVINVISQKSLQEYKVSMLDEETQEDIAFKMEEELLEYYSYLKKVKNFKEKLPQLFNENGGE